LDYWSHSTNINHIETELTENSSKNLRIGRSSFAVFFANSAVDFLVNIFLTVGLVIILTSCSSPTQKPLSFDTSLLKNGDLICRYGNGFFSKYFRQFSDSIQLYSHVGLVHITEDSVHVIHSEASELTGIGVVQRVPLESFLNQINVWGLYRLDQEDSVRNKVIELAYVHYLDRVPFDMDFELDNEEIYCTELVAMCINGAIGQETIKPKTVILGKRAYSVDDTFLVDGIFKVTSSDDVK